MTQSPPPVGVQPPPTKPHRQLDRWVQSQLSQAAMGLSPISLALAQADWLWHLAAAPGRQLELAQKALDLSGQVVRNSGGQASAPDPDPRFAEPEWQQWPFKAWREGFRALDEWWREAAQVEGMDRHHQHLLGFFARQGVDAMAPANWPLSNPVVLKSGLQTAGQSWVKGGQQFLQDVAAQQRAKPSTPPEQLDPLPYAVGEQVAVTPGRVIYRNRLIEVIQYLPSTPEVHAEPLLIIPSCIMKYYILDLSPENSMVRYLVAQGFTVCIISWHNPDASDRQLGMQDYLRLGVMEALAAVQRSTGAERVHTLGYCLGGTFLAMVAAALGRRQDDRRHAGAQQRRHADTLYDHLPTLASVTLLAAQTDFSEPGELGVFIDDDQLQTLRTSMARTGYLSGRQMAGSFQFLNSRDLVWSRNTRRYLLGQDEIGNDMMSWNADVTRLPERMHSEYLSSLFLNNALAAGHYRVDGRGVALVDIQVPLFVVGTVRDHISPWRSVYKIHLLTDTSVTFVLAAGGHNAGIVSEPGRPRRSYQIATTVPADGWIEPEIWAAQAPLREGSWWEAYRDWLQARSGPRQAPPPIPPELQVGDAPGLYVKERYAD